jgi:hypothetical protein
MLCYCCGKSKNELHPKKSAIMEGVVVLMCTTCIEAKFEPRWLVVIAGRQKGPEFVRDYVIKRRYIGKIITAEELIV